MNDENFMRLALQLAEKGRGKTSPNPMVGAVVVKGNRILSQGYHRRYGGPHAEAVALKACGEKAKSATLYINLEPCCHFGNTPPCTDLIIRSGIKKVICATIDPDPRVNGKGLAALIESGINVSLGVQEKEARKLNQVYFKYVTTGLPFVILTVVQSFDGRVLRQTRASRSGASRFLTAPFQSSKRWINAILCEVDSVDFDDPGRLCKPKGSARSKFILVGTRRRISERLKKLGKSAESSVIVVPTDPVKKTAKTQTRFTSWALKKRRNGEIDPLSLLKMAGKEGITSLLVNGGTQIATSLLKQGLVDNIWYYISPRLSGKGQEPFGDLKIRKISDAITLKDCEFSQHKKGLLVTGHPVVLRV
jgi:diaminohydroxyphosphoribosylaminopyrimidine deaminase/5-amino-6-(5-phosphoribosylamino)uracil reductase